MFPAALQNPWYEDDSDEEHGHYRNLQGKIFQLKQTNLLHILAEKIIYQTKADARELGGREQLLRTLMTRQSRYCLRKGGEEKEQLMDEMNKAIDSEIALANRLFKEECNTLIPVAFAQLYFMDNGLEAYDELVKAQVVFANHPYLKKAKEDIEEMVKPKDNPKTAFIGQQFTDLEMADPDGKMHKMSELVGEGKYVLVDFWASWCGPCRAEMPNVLEAYNKYHDKGFEVIGISFDNKKDAWVKAVGQLNLPWLQLSDLKGWQCAAAPIYKIDAIPDNILIDPQGKIIDRALRGKSLHNRLQQIFDKQ